MFPTIRRGSTGNAVYELQRLLSSMGYYSGRLDSMFGGLTQQAVLAFQRDYGLTPDGVVGPNTWAALGGGSAGSHPTLRMGSRGGAVQMLQMQLQTLGYYNGAIDGIFGAQTQQAVRAFQRDYGLVQDGVVGPNTWAALDNVIGD